MISVSTAWNAARHAGWAPAAAEIVALGHSAVALDGAALHSDAMAAAREVRAVRGEIVALFAPPPRRDDTSVAVEGLVAPGAERRQASVGAAIAAGRAALDAGTRRVVLRVGEIPDLDPSRETRWRDRLLREGSSQALAEEVRAVHASVASDRPRFVDALCRALFDAARAVPEAQWLLETPSRALGLPMPDDVEAVLGELPRRAIGYWHDAGHAARLAALGLVPAEEWLARLGPRTAGVTLADWSPSGGDLPPGAGVVAWTALRAQLTDAMPRVLRLDPAVPAAFLADAVREAAVRSGGLVG